MSATASTTTSELSAWRLDTFAESLVGRSPHTRAAYERDVTEFAVWAARGGCPQGPGALDHRTLRRFLAYLDTRGFARSTIAAVKMRRPKKRSRPVTDSEMRMRSLSLDEARQYGRSRRSRSCVTWGLGKSEAVKLAAWRARRSAAKDPGRGRPVCASKYAGTAAKPRPRKRSITSSRAIGMPWLAKTSARQEQLKTSLSMRTPSQSKMIRLKSRMAASVRRA